MCRIACNTTLVIRSTLERPAPDVWIAAHDFGRFTPRTITDPDAFRDAIDAIDAVRQTGYWHANQYFDIGLAGIASALFDRHGKCVGAISMTFQTLLYPEDRPLTQLLPALQEVVKVLRDII